MRVPEPLKAWCPMRGIVAKLQFEFLRIGVGLMG